MRTQDMAAARTHRREGRSRLLAAGVALTALAALSAGCSTTTISEYNPVDYDHELRHPILISQEPENLTMPVGMNGPALSPEIEQAIAHYVTEYQSDGTGAITIQVPTGSANEMAAATTGRAVHYALVRSGVSHNRIRIAPYAVDDHARIAPLRLSYLRVKAVVPGCGVWPDAGQADHRNAQYQDFACAQRQNLAAMVANPADLIRPQPMGASSGARRAGVINNYGQGNDTRSNVILIPSGIGG